MLHQTVIRWRAFEQEETLTAPRAKSAKSGFTLPGRATRIRVDRFNKRNRKSIKNCETNTFYFRAAGVIRLVSSPGKTVT
ncbi:hypothetical protein SBV1_2750009 [Verrucomicrobia bacterium]|nr:hypothetical protein SBV1_2750009 [Verrucomicrobiota bacterium]